MTYIALLGTIMLSCSLLYCLILKYLENDSKCKSVRYCVKSQLRRGIKSNKMSEYITRCTFKD